MYSTGRDAKTELRTGNKGKRGENGVMGHVDPYFDMEIEPVDVVTA